MNAERKKNLRPSLTPEAATLAGLALEDEEFIVSECTFHGGEE